MDQFIQQQLTNSEDVVLLSSAGRSADLKYLVMMSQSDIVPGRNAQASRHHVLCTFRVRSHKAVHGWCGFPICKKSIMKQSGETILGEDMTGKMCVHMEKVFLRNGTQEELQELADRARDPATLLDSVVFDCSRDVWLPAPQCPQTPIPLTPSLAQSDILMTHSLACHIQKNGDDTKPLYLSNKNIAGMPCSPAFSETCPSCGECLSKVSDYLPTASFVLQYSSSMGVVQRSILLLVCPSPDCDWKRKYDPDIDCLHCFGKNGNVWQAGERNLHSHFSIRE
jgi:hypothetical protein